MPIFYSLLQQHKVFKIIAKKTDKYTKASRESNPLKTSQKFEKYVTSANETILDSETSPMNKNYGRSSIVSDESDWIHSPKERLSLNSND